MRVPVLVVIALTLSGVAAAVTTAVVIEAPTEGQIVSGPVVVSGYAFPASAVTGVNVTVLGMMGAPATLGAVSGGSVAWTFALDTFRVPDGKTPITARTETAGTPSSHVVNATFVNAPAIAVASPAPHAQVSGVVTVTGTASSPWLPVANVEVGFGTPPVFVPATFGGSATAVTWSAGVDSTDRANGAHMLRARVTTAHGDYYRQHTVTVPVTVANPVTRDLVVVDVRSEDDADVVVTLRNLGNTATPPFDLRLQVDDEGTWRDYATARVNVVPGFGGTEVRVPWSPVRLFVGTYTMRAVADARGEVAETLESNNAAEGEVTLVTGLVQLP